MKHLAALFAAFTIGALSSAVVTERDHAKAILGYEMLLGDAQANTERAYLDGLRDAGGAVESCRDRPDLCSDESPKATLAHVHGSGTGQGNSHGNGQSDAFGAKRAKGSL